MLFDIERIKENVQKASLEDLLDRATVYRAGMEPEALEIIEAELRKRGVDQSLRNAHAAQRDRSGILQRDGIALKCSLCNLPAVAQGWGWQRVGARRPEPLTVWPLFYVVILLTLPFDYLPLYWPRYFSYCEEHRPDKVPSPPEDGDGVSLEGQPHPLA